VSHEKSKSKPIKGRRKKETKIIKPIIMHLSIIMGKRETKPIVKSTAKES